MLDFHRIDFGLLIHIWYQYIPDDCLLLWPSVAGKPDYRAIARGLFGV